MIWGLLGTLLGLGMLVYGSNLLVDGAAGIAKKKGISGHIIGVTLVATATSLPELATAVTATFTGNHGIAIGNVVGSNAFNVGIVLAVSVLILPILPDKMVLRDGWIVILSTSVFALFAVGGLMRWESAILFLGYLAYTYYLYRSTVLSGEVEVGSKGYTLLAFMLLIGTALLALGSPLLVHSASSLANSLSVEDSIIAVTLIAAGTSLPELVTGITAAVKGHEGIAVGNVLGSNLFNILLIPGLAGLIHPLTVSKLLAGSLIPAMMLLTLIGVLLSRKKMGRKEGLLLLLGFVAFMALLIQV